MKCPECSGELVFDKNVSVTRRFPDKEVEFSVYFCHNKECGKGRNKHIFFKNTYTGEPIDFHKQPVSEQEIERIESIIRYKKSG